MKPMMIMKSLFKQKFKRIKIRIRPNFYTIYSFLISPYHTNSEIILPLTEIKVLNSIDFNFN